MSETTPRFGLPLIAAGQAQKHVPVNEALAQLDALIHLSVLGRLSTPPEGPEEGDRYIVGTAATGMWAGQARKIASFDGGWQFLMPREGWLCWDAAANELVVFTDGNWVVFSSGEGGGGGGGDFQNIPLLGIGAEADETNPFTAKLNAALWTARETDDEGTGDLRYVMNKQASANVLSLLFQSAFGGRAEMGLIGDEDFLFKVSADGTLWHEALRIDRTTGRALFPQGGVREALTENRIYYVRTDGSDLNDGRENSAGRAFQTIQKALNAAATIDFNGHAVTVQLGDGTYTAGGVVPVTVGQANIPDFVIKGNAAAPGNVIVSTTSASCFVTAAGARVRVLDMELRTTTLGHCLQAVAGSVIAFDNIRFGTCARAHLSARGGLIECANGAYSIVGGAQQHILCSDTGAYVETRSNSVTLAGEPSFSTAFCNVSTNATARLNSNSYSGAATGVRYIAEKGGWIETLGASATYLPGNADGIATSPGGYS